MPIIIALFVCSLVFIAIGISGFSKRGIQISKTLYWNGNKGKVVGTICILAGILLMPVGYGLFRLAMMILDPRSS
jgi:hypothetical protein